MFMKQYNRLIMTVTVASSSRTLKIFFDFCFCFPKLNDSPFRLEELFDDGGLKVYTVGGSSNSANHCIIRPNYNMKYWRNSVI